MSEAIAALITISLLVGLLVLVRIYLKHRYADIPGSRLRRQSIWLGCVVMALLVALLSLPMSPSLRGQLLSLIGIVVSATIALSSTTFVGNAMAGVMLRAVRNFRIGDFIEVDGQFGRVAETGLLHVEIQTEDRDLTTLPNLYLVQNPVKVIQAEGTIVSATLSLGYDLDHDRVESLLLDAGDAVGLSEGFVQITELGDFSVSYRVAGMLKDVRKMLTARSRLRAEVMDTLHADGIEVLSPTYMMTRALDPGYVVVPSSVGRRDSTGQPGIESLAFDKAERAHVLERLRERWQSVSDELTKLMTERDKAEEAKKPDLDRKVAVLQGRLHRLKQRIDSNSDAVAGLETKKS